MTNPNGANQYQLDPRQKLCWDFYANPKSETFNSGLASALKAGYTDGTARQITTEKWFIDKLRTLNMHDKAENVLNDMLEMDAGMEASLLKLKQDTAKFIAGTMPKYSQKQDITSDGKPLPTIIQIIKPEEPSKQV